MALIRCAAGTIYAPGADLPVTEATLELALNKAGALSFTLARTHPLADALQLLRTEVWVEQEGAEIFRGRVLQLRRDMQDNREVTCEGLKGYLRDERLRPVTAANAAGFLSACCRDYNNSRPQAVPFALGEVEEPDGADISSGDYPTLMDAIDRLLLTPYGGMLTVTRTVRGGGPVNLMSYTLSEGPPDGQEIVYGVNLLDLSDEIEVKNLCTAVLPLGKTTDDTKLTVASVNGGRDYIVNDAAAAQYGLIVKTENLPEIDDAAALKKAGFQAIVKLEP